MEIVYLNKSMKLESSAFKCFLQDYCYKSLCSIASNKLYFHKEDFCKNAFVGI